MIYHLTDPLPLHHQFRFKCKHAIIEYEQTHLIDGRTQRVLEIKSCCLAEFFDVTLVQTQ